MNLIVAVDENWAIGNKNELLIRIPADHKMFRQETTGKVVVLGRKTLETFPNAQPLKNRTNIILGSIVLVFIYVAMCFCEGVSGFGFKLYPYDLIYNMGHYSSFFIGCVISLFKNIVEMTIERSVKNK